MRKPRPKSWSDLLSQIAARWLTWDSRDLSTFEKLSWANTPQGRTWDLRIIRFFFGAKKLASYYEITRRRGRRRMKGKEKDRKGKETVSTYPVKSQATVLEGLWLSIKKQTILRHGDFVAMEEPFESNPQSRQDREKALWHHKITTCPPLATKMSDLLLGSWSCSIYSIFSPPR